MVKFDRYIPTTDIGREYGIENRRVMIAWVKKHGGGKVGGRYCIRESLFEKLMQDGTFKAEVLDVYRSA